MVSWRPEDAAGDQEDVQFFLDLLASHRGRFYTRTMRLLPSEPRCYVCHAPFGGTGGKVMRRFGIEPSRKNPGLCNSCFEKAPMGGSEMEIGVLFADVRGFTSLSETMAPDDVATLLNRFYAEASRVLTKHAIIDKLVGDEVMALYIPFILGDGWADELMGDACDLLRAVGYGSDEGPWLPLGVGIDAGRAYVGNVGAGDVKDFTALGDVVNTAARLQGRAEGGQVVLSERVYERLGEKPDGTERVDLELKGKGRPESARVLTIR